MDFFINSYFLKFVKGTGTLEVIIARLDTIAHAFRYSRSSVFSLGPLLLFLLFNVSVGWSVFVLHRAI